jgi:hypothetical protein
MVQWFEGLSRRGLADHTLEANRILNRLDSKYCLPSLVSPCFVSFSFIDTVCRLTMRCDTLFTKNGLPVPAQVF